MLLDDALQVNATAKVQYEELVMEQKRLINQQLEMKTTLLKGHQLELEERQLTISSLINVNASFEQQLREMTDTYTLQCGMVTGLQSLVRQHTHFEEELHLSNERLSVTQVHLDDALRNISIKDELFERQQVKNVAIKTTALSAWSSLASNNSTHTEEMDALKTQLQEASISHTKQLETVIDLRGRVSQLIDAERSLKEQLRVFDNHSEDTGGKHLLPATIPEKLANNDVKCLKQSVHEEVRTVTDTKLQLKAACTLQSSSIISPPPRQTTAVTSGTSSQMQVRRLARQVCFHYSYCFIYYVLIQNIVCCSRFYCTYYL